MPTKLKRVTFVVTPEIEKMLNVAKKEVYYDCTRSDMIRSLLVVGLEVTKSNKKKKSD